MKQISLFSNKRSVLNYWQKHINNNYSILVYDNLLSLYKDIEKSDPDVILFDYNGDVGIAEELLEYTKSKKTGSYIMVLNIRPLFYEGIRLLRKDAKAFMNAYAKPENLNQAIESVLNGNIWLYREFIQAMIKQSLVPNVGESDLMQQLSSREREIAQLVALGMTNKEVATQADITEQTVKTHLKAIYEKVGVHTRLELAIKINQIENSY